MRLCASTEKIRNDWFEATFSAIEQCRENRRKSLFIGVVEEKPVEEKMGDVRPVPFPKELADICQVKTFSFLVLLPGAGLQCKIYVVQSLAS